jgi:uncharacterized protein YgfB (UPF0149 family)
MLRVTFPEISKVLQELNSSVPAAESHGCLCGALCATLDYPMARWFEEIIPESPAAEEEAPQDVPQEADAQREPLQILFSDTLNSLRGDQMDFEPLLPDDDVSLNQRAHALSQWCQGFLYGFGTGQRQGEAELPANVDEILKDFTHIGRASVELEEESESEEEAYSEVVEYVRAAVQLIHDELIPTNPPDRPDSSNLN